ncbi:MAG: ComF family protein [Oscillatoriales cyanobacterium RM2_1_1]|nr:ComF family protein [Oscillatoriales cyanobacterium SM2_3_0]NJO46644.1 ComF family protein [Oscillatoriales cyanobacterium RM2_1_1]
MLRNFAKTVLSFFLRPNCPLCDRPADRELCLYCERQLLQCKSLSCYSLADQVPVLVWGRHQAALKRAIAVMKYQNHPEIAQILGEQLADGWLEASLNFPKLALENDTETLVVVPIPMFAQKQKQRGFNQAELIARHFCRGTGFPLKAAGLERVRETEAQFQLSAQQRQANLKQAFQLGQDFRHSPPKASILLVDDIFTTGATVQAALQTLTQAKLTVKGILAVSTTKPPSSNLNLKRPNINHIGTP